MNIFGRPILLVALLASQGFAQDNPPAGNWLEHLSVTASGSVNWVENISRTSFEPTRKDATTYGFSLGATRPQQLAPAWLGSAGVEADFLIVPEYNRTNIFEIGPRLGLQRKFGLGPLAPILQFGAAFTYKSARLAADRGWTAEGSLRLAKRLNPLLQLAASGQWLDHHADSATFDIQQQILAVEAVWDINENWRLSGAVSRLTGRVVANAAPAVWAQAISGGLGSTVSNYYNSIPWSVTSLYGPGWVSYNVEAEADLWSLALACAVSEHTSLELRTSRARVTNNIDIRYPTDSWGLGLIHRF